MPAPRILLAVTAATSLDLMTGLPHYLSRCGWDVHVVSSPGPQADALEADALETGSAVTVHRLAMERNPAPGRDLRALLQWIRLLRDVRPDIISVGTPKAGLLGAVAGRLTRVPSRVYMLRGLRYETSTGLARRVLLATERIACASAHHSLAVSTSLQTMAVDDRLVSPRRITVVGHGSSNGVDPDRFATPPEARRAAQAARWPSGADVPVIGFIGRLHPDKGLDLLADAMAELSRRGTAGRLLVLGPVDTRGEEDYEGRLRASGFPVEFAGEVPDVAPYLRLMDILCLPTKREGFPNVVLEAAAAGIPTVATPATGIDDSIQDGITGLITSSRDPSELADLLEQLLTDTAARERTGRNARAMVEERFARPNVQKNYERYYRIRMASHSGPRRLFAPARPRVQPVPEAPSAPAARP